MAVFCRFRSSGNLLKDGLPLSAPPELATPSAPPELATPSAPPELVAGWKQRRERPEGTEWRQAILQQVSGGADGAAERTAAIGPCPASAETHPLPLNRNRVTLGAGIYRPVAVSAAVTGRANATIGRDETSQRAKGERALWQRRPRQLPIATISAANGSNPYPAASIPSPTRPAKRSSWGSFRPRRRRMPGLRRPPPKRPRRIGPIRRLRPGRRFCTGLWRLWNGAAMNWPGRLPRRRASRWPTPGAKCAGR